MLKSLRKPNGELICFSYDALGRRTHKYADGKVYRYLWDGEVLLHQWEYPQEQIRKEKHTPESLSYYQEEEPVEKLVSWIYEPDSYVPLGRLEEDQGYVIASDYLGRAIGAFDEQGDLIWKSNYDIYGRVKYQGGDRNFVPFRQLGQFEDTETGLYYNRFRYYNPETGSYISSDPIGLASGEFNFYSYVRDSNTQVDPLGLTPLGSKNNPFTSLKQAMNRAKDLAGIPRSQQPLAQWRVGDDITKKGSTFNNYQYSANPTSHGRMYEYVSADGRQRVIVIHSNDGLLHVHAGTPDMDIDYNYRTNPYNFRGPRYKPIDDPHLKDHHLFVKTKCK